MSKTSPNSINSEFNQEKRKLLYWISQWSRDQANIQTDVDIPELSVLLQIMGYKLESLEKISEVKDFAVASTSAGVQSTSRVQIACSTSGLNGTFINHASACKCPTNEDVNNGQFWSVTGCGPRSSQNSINSSTSSLIPTISKGKLEIIAYLMTIILEIVKNAEVHKELKLEDTQKVNLTRHRSLDTINTNENLNLVNGSLNREMSCEVDPKTTRPRKASSPIPDLTHTLSRISLDSENIDIVKKLEAIQILITKTLEIADRNRTYNKKIDLKRKKSDMKTAEGTPVKKLMPKSCPSTPRKQLTPKRYLPSSGKQFGIQTPVERPLLRRIPTPTTLQNIAKWDNSKTSLKNSGLCKVADQGIVFKSKQGTSSKIKSMGMPTRNRNNLSSTGGLGKFKNLTD